MGFFSRPTTKKPPPARPAVAAPARPGSAFAVAAALVNKVSGVAARRPVEPVPEGMTAADNSMIQWATPGQPAFEVAAANPGLCEALENAALFYASGKAEIARKTLEHALQTDQDAQTSPLAWLALFDMLQRAGDRQSFDRVAMTYALQFERTAPAWESQTVTVAGPRPQPGGYIALAGKLGVSHAPQIDGIRRAIAKQLPKVRLDLSRITDIDDAGANLLVEALAAARRARLALEIEHAEKLLQLLDAAVRRGREGGQGPWQLSLELLQWQGDHAAFDERAIEFAVTFELSPPSWEPSLVTIKPDNGSAAGRDGLPEADMFPGYAEDALRWSGVMVGPTSPQLAGLPEFAHGRSLVPIDLSGIERIDFVCAGAMLNAITAVEMQRKSVQIIGASPIIRVLLLLIGISPRHFVKRD
jgi:ABC-type transporter Mla MlaB component